MKSNNYAARVITDRHVEIVNDLRQTQSAAETGKRFGMSAQSVATMIRRVEGNIGAALFSRRVGRSVKDWKPLETEGWSRLADRDFRERLKQTKDSEEIKIAKLRRQWRKSRGVPEPLTPEPEACEVCGRQRDLMAKALHVDHCHETGKFRGWLCNKCNGAIGMLGDNAEGLRRALAYLEKAETQQPERQKAELGARPGRPSPAGVGSWGAPVTVSGLYNRG